MYIEILKGFRKVDIISEVMKKPKEKTPGGDSFEYDWNNNTLVISI